MATLIKVDGTEAELRPRNGRDFRLQELYAALGCTTVEPIYLDDGRVMLTDEDGLLMGRPVNRQATEIVGPKVDMITAAGAIVGDVLICSRGELGD
jgi:Domain of unknown function (DUF3846)